MPTAADHIAELEGQKNKILSSQSYKESMYATHGAGQKIL